MDNLQTLLIISKLILNAYPKRTLSTTFNKNLKVKLATNNSK